MDCWELLPVPGPAVAFIKRYLHCHSPFFFIIAVDLIEMMRPSLLQYHVVMTHGVQLFSLMQTGSLGIKNAFQMEVCVTSHLIFLQKGAHLFIYPPLL